MRNLLKEIILNKIMALVQVDLSEYDMLREAKQKAEKDLENSKNEIKELKNTISGLVNKSRMVVKTKHAFIDSEKIAALIGSYYNNFEYVNIYSSSVSVSNLHKCIVWAIDRYKELYPEEQDYYVNFEDVKDEITKNLNDKLKEEYNKTILDLKEAKEEYNRKSNTLSNDYKKAYDEKCASYKKECDKVYNSYKENIEKEKTSLEKEINKLNSKLEKLSIENKELNKSLEEKQVDALKELKEAQEKYNKLINRKGFFKLFLNHF